MIAAAYEGAAAAWAEHAAPVYCRLAAATLERCPTSLAGARVLDVGTGTGALGSLLAGAGAVVVGVDRAHDMLCFDRSQRPPGVRADALALPVRSSCFDAALAACLVNHFERPAEPLAAAAAAVRSGGSVVASAFAAVPDPVKEAVDGVAREHGWLPPAWYLSMKAASQRLVGHPEAFAEIARAAGLRDVVVHECAVPMAGLTAREAVAYRLALPQLSRWAAERPVVAAEAIAACAPLVSRWTISLLVAVGTVS